MSPQLSQDAAVPAQLLGLGRGTDQKPGSGIHSLIVDANQVAKEKQQDLVYNYGLTYPSLCF